MEADRQRRLIRQTVDEQSSSEDEFEKEMQSELDDKMKTIEQGWTAGLSCVQTTYSFCTKANDIVKFSILDEKRNSLFWMKCGRNCKWWFWTDEI